jgi:hypothetical protein
MQDDVEARSRARSTWPTARHRLREGAAPDGTTGEQRLAMMWELVVQAWAIAGREIPDYERPQMRVSIRRLGDEAT